MFKAPEPDKPATKRKQTAAQQPPTLAEATAYFAELGQPEWVAADFIDYWSSVGWKRGKSPMLDWRGTARQRDRQLKAGGKLGAPPAEPVKLGVHYA